MTKAIVISQLKYTGQLEDILLLRAARRINRFVKPDIAIIFTADGETPPECLQKVIETINCPVLLPDTDENSIDTADCRFTTANSSSDSNDLAADFTETVVTCIKDTSTPVKGSSLVISGNGKDCAEITDQDYGKAVTIPDFNNKPFPFAELDINDKGEAALIQHSLSAPAELELWDTHVHSRFAYCNENMRLDDAIKLSKMFNLKGIAFTEHNRHLYYPLEELKKPVIERKEKLRVDEYFKELDKYRSDTVLAGLELDFDFRGLPTMRAADMERFDIILGAVHGLPRLSFEDLAVATSNFKGLWLNAAKYKFAIMAHPFRVMWKGSSEHYRCSNDDYLWMTEFLKEHSIAAEINFNGNEPDAEFFRICIEEGVKIALGTDSHNLANIGEFYPHFRLLDSIGALSELDSILYNPMNRQKT
jgi:histidinol phosphatase-like PHP family hydrolase